MKNRLSLAVLASILSPSILASTAIPSAPDITSPSNEAVNVSVTPLLSANPATTVNSDDGVPVSNFKLLQTSWMIYEPIESVQLLGGYYDSSNGLTYGDRVYTDVPVNIDLEVDNEKVTTLRVKTNAQVELRSAAGEILGLVSGLPRTASDVALGGDELIKIKTFNNAIVINWPLNTFIGNTDINFVMQAIIADGGSIGIRSSIADINNSLFDQPGGVVGCQMRLNDVLLPASNMKSLASWKGIFQSNDIPKWSLLCTPNSSGDDIKVQNLNDPSLASFDKPVIKNHIIYDEATGDELLSYQLKADEALHPGTKYHLIQQQAINAQIEGSTIEVFTPWSAPVSFTTALDTDYSTDIRGASDFITGQAKTFQITVTNSGVDTGTPKLELKVPVDALSLIDGSMTDFFAIESAGEQCSDTTIKNNITTLSCNLSPLAAGQSRALNATITVNNTVNNIEYRVCDAISCESTEFQNLAINVTSPSDAGSDASGKTTSTSGSSGGGAFALLLLITPFLRRRKLT